MIIVRTVPEIREALTSSRQRTVALVPTMGALHRGHLSLFHAARQQGDVVVASIFVNPSQFSDPRDLAAYPRDEAADASAAEGAGVDVLFAPMPTEIYPADFSTWVEPAGAALGFEGAFRPGHFRGVATVCLKLFTIVQPTIACFGQKDAQQVAVLKQLVRDCNLPLEIRVGATERDVDGLALSSRNVRLSPEERRRAGAMPRALLAGLDAFRRGADPGEAAAAALGELALDYAAVADFDGLPTLVIAARAGATRLIDNLPLTVPELGGLAQLTRAMERATA